MRILLARQGRHRRLFERQALALTPTGHPAAGKGGGRGGPGGLVVARLWARPRSQESRRRQVQSARRPK
jgi:hypothetical protein